MVMLCCLFNHFYLFFKKQSIDGISDIRDESDRSGMRIVIEVRGILGVAAMLCMLHNVGNRCLSKSYTIKILNLYLLSAQTRIRPFNCSKQSLPAHISSI